MSLKLTKSKTIVFDDEASQPTKSSEITPKRILINKKKRFFYKPMDVMATVPEEGKLVFQQPIKPFIDRSMSCEF